MVLILVGVSGSGKSTVGRILAKSLNGRFYDADDYHPPSNREKLKEGIPLTDADRKPWLDWLHELIGEWLKRTPRTVLACSALKQAYRDRLKDGRENVHFVYLKGDLATIRSRVEGKKDRLLHPSLLPSQFEELEEPKDVLTLDIHRHPEELAEAIRKHFGLK